MVKYALVTGSSTGGIGWCLCREFQKHGVHVFATARSLEKLRELRELENVTAISLDVTRPESIAAAKEQVTKVTGGKLDYLVNNSGAQYVAPILDFDIQLGRDMFEVNVWGVLAVVQAFSRLLISSKGTVANVASISGLLNVPWMGMLRVSSRGRRLFADVGTGVYGGSKAALSLISETLRVELAPFDVKVITCITGAVKTNIMTNSYKQSLPEDSIYQPASKEITDRASGTEKLDTCSPEEFSQKLVKDVMGGSSGKVYRGKMASISSILSTYVPSKTLVGCPNDSFVLPD
jgi:1-acylglycerone phosphate reductase